MRNERWIMLILAILIVGGSAFFNIKGAVECADKGGAYIVPQNSWPVCVAGVK